MIAVLTGDLVNSTKMSDDTYSKIITHLQQLLLDVNKKHGASGELYRGDEFQIHYPVPAHALKSALLIKLSLHLSALSAKPIQCTLSLAYGSYNIYDNSPSTSSGAAYIASGRGLEKTQRGELSLHLQANNDHCEMKLLLQFLNHLLNRLTKTQAELLYQYIENDFVDHKEMAKITGTTRQNISNRLSNIGAFLVRDYMEIINQKVEQLTGSN